MAGFRKAKAEQAAIKIGLYGPPGSGKTLTSLMCAEGIVAGTGKRVAFVDTERGTDFYCKAIKDRAVHPEAFDFDAIYTRSITEVLAEVKKIDTDVYGVLVLDSITHIWEAARAAYTGKTGAGGQIPFHAWGNIKKPYKELIAFLLSSPLHVFICGRQGNEFAEDEDGELKRVGTKMKAEGETAYEPHILIRMECVKDRKGIGQIHAFAEKDRTGILAGKTIINPTFNTLVAPIVAILSGTQAHIETEEETAARDGERIADTERAKAVTSGNYIRKFGAQFESADTDAEVEAVSKSITADIKKQMNASDVAALRDLYHAAKARVKEPVMA